CWPLDRTPRATQLLRWLPNGWITKNPEISMRALLGAGLALTAVVQQASAQSEAALRRAFEGKTVTVRIDMPATSQGIDVNPLEADPVSFREVAQRLKEHGTAARIGQQMMISKVAVRDWYI